MTFDPYSPPGILTARGSNLSIDSTGALYVGHGSHSVVLDLTPLQWQLVAVGIARMKHSRDDHGPMVFELTKGRSLTIRRSRLHLIELRAKGRGGVLTVGLTNLEADDLEKAARLRSPQPTNKGA